MVPVEGEDERQHVVHRGRNHMSALLMIDGFLFSIAFQATRRLRVTSGTITYRMERSAETYTRTFTAPTAAALNMVTHDFAVP